jgi:hypothetical protein
MFYRGIKQDSVLASTRIPGVRDKLFFDSSLVIGKLKFNILGVQDSGDLSLRFDNRADKFIGEDFVSISSNGFIAVGDGVGPVHNSADETLYFGVYPYGLLPGLVLESVAINARGNISILNILECANNTLDTIYASLGLVPYIPHQRGGACFAIAKFGTDVIELIGGGDT